MKNNENDRTTLCGHFLNFDLFELYYIVLKQLGKNENSKKYT